MCVNRNACVRHTQRSKICGILPHPLCVHELVHAPRTKGGSHHISDGHAGVDVADQLGLALAGVSSFLEEDDLGLLRQNEG